MCGSRLGSSGGSAPTAAGAAGSGDPWRSCPCRLYLRRAHGDPTALFLAISDQSTPTRNQNSPARLTRPFRGPNQPALPHIWPTAHCAHTGVTATRTPPRAAMAPTLAVRRCVLPPCRPQGPRRVSPFPARPTPSLLPEEWPAPPLRRCRPVADLAPVLTSPFSPAPLPDTGPPARCPNHARAHIHARTTARATHQTTPEPRPAHAPAPARCHANDGGPSARLRPQRSGPATDAPCPGPPSCPQCHPRPTIAQHLCRCDGTGPINNRRRRRCSSAACVRVRTCGVWWGVLSATQAGRRRGNSCRHASKQARTASRASPAPCGASGRDVAFP